MERYRVYAVLYTYNSKRFIQKSCDKEKPISILHKQTNYDLSLSSYIYYDEAFWNSLVVVPKILAEEQRQTNTIWQLDSSIGVREGIWWNMD
jgi:hypothetical protein